MTKKVTFVEFTIYERVYPLVSGYLQAYACRDASIKNSFTFEKYSTTIKTPPATILRDLKNSDADIYAFSCYLWNMGLVRNLLPALLESKPNAHILLGGPQVMHHGYKYLNPRHENMVICNGEGEKTFSDYLGQLTNAKPNYSDVRGLTFYRDGELVTTEKNERLKDLDEIPSPFLNGIFDKPYTMATFETNRGCPFSCGFCYWGAATNAKVFTFSEDRIREELTWLSEHNCVFIYLVDANWGIYARDVGLTEHIGELARRTQMPSVVYYSAAKNKPERMTQITEIFTQAGVITSQPVSLQTMSEGSLGLIDRKNIKMSAYVQLQERLNEKKISSFTELIWPLPGETLPSFKEGINKLCGLKADTIISYPQLLLHNTALYENREQLKLVTEQIDDLIGEVEVVVQTADVTYEETDEGMRFFYALHLLHNMRALYNTASYLAQHRNVKHSEVFSAFTAFCKRNRDNPVVDFYERSIEIRDYYDVFNYGKLVHFALHVYREEFESLLCRFVREQPWWDDPIAQALVEIDLINRPYVYGNTAFKKPGNVFERLAVEVVENKVYAVEVPAECLPYLVELVGLSQSGHVPGTSFRVNHKRMQYSYMKSQSLEHNVGYCHGMILRIEHIMPVWTTIEAVPGVFAPSVAVEVTAA